MSSGQSVAWSNRVKRGAGEGKGGVPKGNPFIHSPMNALRWAELFLPFNGRVAVQLGSSIAGESSGETDGGMKTTGGVVRLAPKDRTAN